MNDHDFDVIVAGAGAAGLVAALAAAEDGRSVLLLDAQENYRSSCNTTLSTAMIPGAGTRWQAAAGVQDSPDRFLADVMAKTAGQAEPTIAETLASVSGPVVEWLADSCDVSLELVQDFGYPGHSVHRCHAVADRSGRTLHTQLVRAVAGHPQITTAVPMRLLEVDLDESARVRGATVAPPDGSPENASAGAVILATNGFAARRDMVERYLPEIADGLYFGSDGARGDALTIGEALGADTAYLDAYQGHGSVADPHGVLVTWATVMHGAIIVNLDGERFGDETIGYSEYAEKVLEQPDAHAWLILDERIDAACRPFADYQQLLETRAIRWADDVAKLTRIARPGANLGATLAAAQDAATGAIDPLGRHYWEAPLAPPYGAIHITGALFHTQGGLLVSERAAVLRAGEEIPGLFAAGGAAAGMSGHGASGYMAGNGLLGAVGLGYIAGKESGS